MSCTPFCQLWNLHGPLDTGIESAKASFMLRPFTMCAAQTPADTSASHDAYGRLKTIVAFFPDAATDLMSSQPVRVMMLFFGSTLTCQVARKSAPVTGRPSLQTAFFLNSIDTVNGLRFSNFGLLAKLRRTHFAFASRI